MESIEPGESKEREEPRPRRVEMADADEDEDSEGRPPRESSMILPSHEHPLLSQIAHKSSAEDTAQPISKRKYESGDSSNIKPTSPGNDEESLGSDSSTFYTVPHSRGLDSLQEMQLNLQSEDEEQLVSESYKPMSFPNFPWPHSRRWIPRRQDEYPDTRNVENASLGKNGSQRAHFAPSRGRSQPSQMRTIPSTRRRFPSPSQTISRITVVRHRDSSSPRPRSPIRTTRLTMPTQPRSRSRRRSRSRTPPRSKSLEAIIRRRFPSPPPSGRPLTIIRHKSPPSSRFRSKLKTSRGRWRSWSRSRSPIKTTRRRSPSPPRLKTQEMRTAFQVPNPRQAKNQDQTEPEPFAAPSKRRLFICCDGTSVNASRQSSPLTNVARFARAVLPKTRNSELDIPQVIYYSGGVGSQSVLALPVDKYYSAATGEGLDENILSAYCFLCNNYDHRVDQDHRSGDPDEIVLVGYSRGAFTVRCLADLISQIGLLRRKNLHFLPSLFKKWLEARTDKQRGEMRDHIGGIEAFSLPVTITVLAEWDPVSAIRLSPLRGKLSFMAGTVPTAVKNAFVAVSLHEKRFSFKPLLWEEAKDGVTVKQVAFSGCHGDVGGGNVDAGLSTLSLFWMVAQIKMACGAEIDDRVLLEMVQPPQIMKRRWSPFPVTEEPPKNLILSKGEINESLTKGWLLLHGLTFGWSSGRRRRLLQRHVQRGKSSPGMLSCPIEVHPSVRLLPHTTPFNLERVDLTPFEKELWEQWEKEVEAWTWNAAGEKEVWDPNVASWSVILAKVSGQKTIIDKSLFACAMVRLLRVAKTLEASNEAVLAVKVLLLISNHGNNLRFQEALSIYPMASSEHSHYVADNSLPEDDLIAKVDHIFATIFPAIKRVVVAMREIEEAMQMEDDFAITRKKDDHPTSPASASKILTAMESVFGKSRRALESIRHAVMKTARGLSPTWSIDQPLRAELKGAVEAAADFATKVAAEELPRSKELAKTCGWEATTGWLSRVDVEALPVENIRSAATEACKEVMRYLTPGDRETSVIRVLRGYER
ncbi:hypothetical protein EJ06DRAFT_42518 [Trichodelitschia bisporula]|uniref:T6SS Phospholipase effector Tle1-like catalytic domain-containing protein n=1 Tax=Trichodelitschia bisporula TaxID=703511 RepID=A0A6G1HVP5_9PEZI|nr:hypothetical protein EJ06DRAFT_42518 [Trichodelitschia bisporula]